MPMKLFSSATPNWKHLLWALPLSLFIFALMWWIAASAWQWGEFYEPGHAWLRDGFRGRLIDKFVLSALIGALPVLAANWSRSIWLRVGLALLLIAAQIGFGSLYAMNL